MDSKIPSPTHPNMYLPGDETDSDPEHEGCGASREEQKKPPKVIRHKRKLELTDPIALNRLKRNLSRDFEGCVEPAK